MKEDIDFTKIILKLIVIIKGKPTNQESQCLTFLFPKQLLYSQWPH